MSRERNEMLLDRARRHLVQNYKQQPIVLTRGDGVWVWDVLGHRYLDMTAGIAVSVLGHAHPKLTAAIATQAGRLVHTSNLYYADATILLAEALCHRSFADRVFFCNSGGEANEAAIKLARRYQQVVAGRPEKIVLVSTEGSFHGRTVATVSLTGQEKYRKNFGPLFEPVRFFPYGNLDAAREALSDGKACAVIVEPVQAEGGIIVSPVGFLAGLKQLCVETGTMLIFDEVQTGIGRTGTWFGYLHDGVTPDVMTLAKGLAGGVPIGAMCATEEAAKGFVPLPGEPPPHASTFGGNPLACAAALAVLDVIEAESLLENCREAGEYLARQLNGLVDKHKGVALSVRGRGLLRGLVVAKDSAAIVTRCREKGLLLSLAGANVIRFAPPLIIRREDVDEALRILDEVLGEREAVVSTQGTAP
jgi:predicted acetylornithine/succinylornithine family transaminase